MKIRFIKALVFFTVIIASGCNKKLDTVPTQSIDANVALKTSDDVKVALVGAYKDFGVADFYGGRIFLDADLLADVNELNWTGTYQGMTQINNKSIPVDNLFVTNIWLAGYKAINDVNNVLSSINVLDANDKDRVQGEAEFIRGASYFELVKMFAKDWSDGAPASNPGVPLVLTPTTVISDASKVKRNTVAEVYAQVINDLKDAEDKLPASNGFFATKQAAEAILARVYLQQQDYANAAQYANSAINNAVNNNNGGLVSNYADAFGPKNTIEDIFAIQVTESSGTQGFNEFYSSAQRGDIQINDAHLQLYDPADDRLNLFYNDNGSIYTGKFEELYGNVHTIRLAEMYLIRAESNFRLGTAVGDTPENDINLIRARVNLPPYAAGTLTLDEILLERKLELAFEGFSLDDVKRLNKNVGLLPWNSPKLIFPIPKRELIVNSNLTQNAGY
ncbi:MAG: RagB/SusD family nutrient uptake outer membrane protein [Flavisolibacter sp.]